VFEFQLQAADGPARAGRFTTPHGVVETPVFMPVGTQATVKAVPPRDLAELGAQIVLANTYHLYLRPGEEVIERAGGLHRFMGWERPILTDSGGFQVFSLAARRKLTDEGARFRSHLDGSEHLFTPESVMRTQQRLSADIVMAFDECPPHPAPKERVRAAVERTHAWAERCKRAHERPDQALFGIVQGGVWPDLREESARFLRALDLPGYGIGGLSVGEEKPEMLAALHATTPHLPEGKPRYLMGVGAPEDVLNAIAAGVDMFDSVLPTRNARNGALLTAAGRLNIKNGSHRDDFRPVEDGCGCATCARFSRAYLHHLFRAEELLGYTLASVHNLHFLTALTAGARAAILERRFETYRAGFIGGYTPPDPEARRRNRETRAAALASREREQDGGAAPPP
jgi:queuine tRNA-ribosyltransferase